MAQTQERAGEIQWKLMAPIPYSPNDFEYDIPIPASNAAQSETSALGN